MSISGLNEAWISTIENAVFEVLKDRQNSRGFLHRPFVYDFGLFVLGFPLAFAIAYSASRLFGEFFATLPNVIEIAAYFYVFFVSLFAFRRLFGYAKWLFPPMELIGSSPPIAKNRGVLKWLVGGLILAGTAKFFFG